MDLSNVTRVTVVGDSGLLFEKYGAYESGVELSLQDDGRTLKIFPLREFHCDICGSDSHTYLGHGGD